MKNTQLGTYPVYVQRYLDMVEESELQDAFQKQYVIANELWDSISEEKSTFAYAPGKWTLKELLQHCIDTERIFSFRALCFARKDPNNLPGFEEDDYAANSNAGIRSWNSLKEEFKVVRRSTEILYYSFTEVALNNTGIANNNPSSVISIGFVTIGHLNHHIKIIKERYL